ncbi:MAG TPA: sugar ABC transporter permease, partial [Lachnospiraceae bacterium]|nr:sugar ABC transporter permease [Lachnospiraceae bacterium]
FMNEKEIMAEGYKLFPKELTTSAYEFLLRNPTKLVDAYTVTIFITVVGTVCALFIMSMAGYVLSRRNFKYRNAFSFFIYFTTLFSGGLVPSYILMIKLGLKDNILAMILPGVVSAWSIFLMKNFMKSIPDSLYESAAIDGAGDFRIYWQIFLPLSKPSLATVGLFS